MEKNKDKNQIINTIATIATKGIGAVIVLSCIILGSKKRK